MKVKPPTNHLKKSRPNGIFCLEGEWTRDLKRPSSVRPILELLRAQHPFPPFIHRGVGTTEEFRYYLNRWTQSGYSRYPILYIASHGSEGAICIGDQRHKSKNITLPVLAKLLENKCRGRFIHLGGCETLFQDERRIQSFLRTTNAIAVTGFRREVYWTESTVFELMLFEELQGSRITRRVAHGLEKKVKGRISSLAREVDFRIVVRKDKPIWRMT